MSILRRGGLRGILFLILSRFLSTAVSFRKRARLGSGKRLREWGEFAAKHREVRVSMKMILGYDPMVTSPNHPLVRTVRKVAKKVLGRDVPPCGSQGSTDMAAVSRLGIPIAVLGATRRDSNIHGIDEHVRINDLVSVTKILAHTFLELL